MRKILLVLSAAFVGMTMMAKVVKVKKKKSKETILVGNISIAPTGCFKRDSIETDTLQTDGQPLSKVRLEVDSGNE